MSAPAAADNRATALGGFRFGRAPLAVFGVLAANLAPGLPPAGAADCAPLAATVPPESAGDALIAAVALPPLAPAARRVCTIGIEDFLRARARLLVIDVRDAGEAGRVGLSGAPVLSIDQLAGKRLLRDQSVVLAGDGLDDTSLLHVCQRLRQAGRDVRILSGGVRALNRAGARGIDGDGGALAAYDWLSPADWHRFAMRAPDRLILLGTAPLPRSPGTDRAPRWSMDGDWPTLVGRLRALADTVPDTVLAVATADREQAAALHEALRRAGAGNIYVLRGGWPAYADYLDQQRRIAANAHRVLRHPCGSV